MSDGNAFEDLEQDLVQYSQYGEIILLGDFNSRTGDLKDFIHNDDSAHLPLDNNTYIGDIKLCDRKNKDRKVNVHGRSLIDLKQLNNQIRFIYPFSFT